jgi:hypothetical protein
VSSFAENESTFKDAFSDAWNALVLADSFGTFKAAENSNISKSFVLSFFVSLYFVL